MSIKNMTEEELEKIRPQHIDFLVMSEICRKQDDVDDIEDVFEEWTGVTLDEAMDSALKSSIGLAMSIDPGNGLRLIMNIKGEGETNEQFSEFFGTAYLTGLNAGLEHVRGIDLPSSWTPKSKNFWDLDGSSVTYICAQRVVRAMYRVEDDNEERDDVHPIIIMASLFLDGFTNGCLFDQHKEAMLA